jgi:hypothetical protein
MSSAPSPGANPSLVIDGGDECAALRRSLGATAWFVLEELALRATAEGDGTLIVQVSTRELAKALAVNKDTVTRALARLRDRKHVAVVSLGGSAGAARLSIHAPGLSRSEVDALSRARDATASGVAGRRQARRLRRRGSEGASQLSLLE